MSNNPVVGLPIGGSSRGLVRSGSTVSISTRRRGDDQVRLVGEHYVSRFFFFFELTLLLFLVYYILHSN
jgi:hypothetical protein